MRTVKLVFIEDDIDVLQSIAEFFSYRDRRRFGSIEIDIDFILVGNESPTNRDRMPLNLKDKLDFYTSESEILNIIDQERYDMIFIDFVMPGIDTRNLLDEIVLLSQDYRPAKVLLSGSVSKAIADELLRSEKISKNFVKPLEFSELLDYIKDYFIID